MLDILTALVLGLCIVLGAIAFTGILRIATDKSPTVKVISAALTPYIYKAIMAGQHLALWSLQELDTRLSSEDRKAIADSVYDTLPDSLLVWFIPLPIKILVSRSKFEELVQVFYDDAHTFIVQNEDYFKAQTDILLPPS